VNGGNAALSRHGGYVLIGLTKEQLFLLGEAREVWESLAEAKVLGVPWQEETCTEILIRNLRRSYPGNIEVIPFNKPLEGESGADWIWSFSSVDGSTTATMLVQAKRLDNDGIEYPDIKRNIGSRVPPEPQIDQLIQVASRYGIPALYAFYNHLDDAARVNAVCGSLIAGDRNHVFGFGISIADANDVKAALPNQTFDLHKKHSVALHCLLCTGSSNKRGSGGSPEAIVANLRDRLRVRLSEIRRRPRGPEASDFMTAEHPVVVRARQSKDALAAGTLAVELDLPDVAGVIVFTDGEDDSKVPSTELKP
jgi:hypothetical protein